MIMHAKDMTEEQRMNKKCENCAHCKKCMFGKLKCKELKRETKAENLCYAYEEKRQSK